MQHVFSPAGEAHLVAAMSAQPLLAFDFDGTLAPIVARPSRARMGPGVAARLRTLSGHLPVAIVTGREIADVRPRLGFEPAYIVGSHGAECGVSGEEAPWHSALQEARTWLQTYHAELRQLGVQLEDKRHSIALHYRLAYDQARAARRLEEILREAGPALHVFGGKRVFNIVAASAPDKADAVHRLTTLARREAAVFVGDDVNDEPVFERAPPSWLTIKVGRTTPPSKARFYLDSASEIAMLLERMIVQLAASSPRP